MLGGGGAKSERDALWRAFGKFNLRRSHSKAEGRREAEEEDDRHGWQLPKNLLQADFGRMKLA